MLFTTKMKSWQIVYAGDLHVRDTILIIYNNFRLAYCGTWISAKRKSSPCSYRFPVRQACVLAYANLRRAISQWLALVFAPLWTLNPIGTFSQCFLIQFFVLQVLVVFCRKHEISLHRLSRHYWLVTSIEFIFSFDSNDNTHFIRNCIQL